MFISIVEDMTQEEAREVLDIVVERIENQRPGLIRGALYREPKYYYDYDDE
jgi:hypothetical protein